MSSVSFASRRRLSAIGAVTATFAGAAALATGFAQNPIAILVALIAFLAAIGFGWVTLTSRGPARNRAGWITVLLMMAALIAAIGAHNDGWIIVLGGVMLALSLPLGRFALGRDRKSIEATTPPGVVVAPAVKPVLLINPLSGGGKAAHLDLVDVARGRGIECHEFGPGVDLAQLAADALAAGADVIGVAGGDGSQAVVADLVSAAGAHLVVVPSGTRNHFAMDLGLDRADPLACLSAFGEARMQTIDMARVNGKAFLNNVSMGIYGEVVQSASYRERKIETAIEELPDLVEKPPDLRFTGPDGLPHTTVHIVHVSNNPYLLDVRGAGGRPRLNTGQLGVVTAELGNAAGVTEMFARAALGVLNSSPGFNAWNATTFEVHSDEPIKAGVDGEAVELASPARFVAVPASLHVRLPLDALGRSPAAFVPQIRVSVLELFRRAFLPTNTWQPVARR